MMAAIRAMTENTSTRAIGVSEVRRVIVFLPVSAFQRAAPRAPASELPHNRNGSTHSMAQHGPFGGAEVGFLFLFGLCEEEGRRPTLPCSTPKRGAAGA